MRWLNKNMPQDAEEAGDDDWCAKTSTGYDEDSKRGEYDNYKDGRNNFKSKH